MGSVGHVAFHGCPFCKVVGRKLRMTTVFDAASAEHRESEVFKQEGYPAHQKEATPFNLLPNFNSIWVLLMGL